MNPYLDFVRDAELRVRRGRALPLGGFEPPAVPPPRPDAPCVLIFAPHPDDECLVGGLPLRLLREQGMRVVNVAVTLGSNPARREGRRKELEGACRHLGFDLEVAGLDRVTPETRAGDPEHWKAGVERLAAVIRERRPRAVFRPHAADWNRTHIGTHWIVEDALAAAGASGACEVFDTEYWAAMPDPNLMVESSAADVADLVAATSFHVEEVKRNPYHLLLPPMLQDNVRRGGELVGGQGGAAPDFGFCTLYRRKGGKGPLRLGAGDDLGALFTG
jgi:LmbE family N-acetylglucosaminyl deacetylase